MMLYLGRLYMHLFATPLICSQLGSVHHVDLNAP